MTRPMKNVRAASPSKVTATVAASFAARPAHAPALLLLDAGVVVTDQRLVEHLHVLADRVHRQALEEIDDGRGGVVLLLQVLVHRLALRLVALDLHRADGFVEFLARVPARA